ncbi:Crp/Fnr family transcriptional regulator [Paenibacillus tritici]|uniref:Crp/Fnr family transcriptional regulator n=1 Tax=Paenibacillus tritici TaxID=1873425 RepID=A0ABX2DSB8_9BACL|nr:Crp/Fnr family transcriptional regulator [Paenibacillus tritici]NQX46469.1 Crp/Fnr family transcriptional regulator [Paenibacillus tritici]
MKHRLRQYMTRLTSLSEAEQQAILDEILVEEYSKGTILLRQGEVPGKCYFVLQGCVRQHSVDITGRDITSNLYTEEQAIAIFNAHKEDASSEYSLTCLEDCVLVVGALNMEQAMYAKHAQLEGMTRRMIEENFGQMQEEFAAFVASSPEDRLKTLMQTRPGLISRVPQHQLASYLGMTPESLSRIKKRLQRERAELEF